MKYTRNCPICNNEIIYTNKRSIYGATSRNSKCKSCQNQETRELRKTQKENGETWGGIRNRLKEQNMERNFHRNCPDCNNEMSYTSIGTLNTAIQQNTICNSCSAYKYNKTFKDIISEEHILQMRATKAGFSTWEEYKEKYPEKEMYKREVWRHTYRNDLTVLPNNDKRGRCGVDGAYQLDHIISINEGWEKNIPAEEIGSMDNLQILTWEENRKKW